MRSILILLLFLSVGLTVSCQNKKSFQTPEAVQKTFEEKYPGENDPDWHLDSHGNYESHFKIDGVKYRADFAADGTWIETETNIDMDQLPQPIREEISTTYIFYTIAELEKVEHHRKGLFYDVEFKLKGKNMDIEFRPDGTVIND